MTRIGLLIVLALAARAAGQGSLGADLDRVESRTERFATTESPEVSRLARQAANAVRGGRIDEAVGLLDKAAAIAYRSGATGRAFELSLTAAEAIRKAGRWRSAAERFRHAALQNPRDPRAATAHLTACQAMARDLSDVTAVDTYQRMLVEHTATWPDAASAESIAWQEVRLLARRRRWAELLERVRGFPADHPRHDESVEFLIFAHEGLVESDPAPDRFESARRDLQGLLLGDGAPTWPSEWSRLQRDVALVLARAAIGRSPEADLYAERLLKEATREDRVASSEWRRRARSALAVIELRKGRESEALAIVSSVDSALGEGELRRLLRVASREVSSTASRDELLSAVDRLAAGVATLSGERVSEAEAARALADVGRHTEAITAYRELAQNASDNRALQTELARLLTKSGSADERREGLILWRAIESRESRGTPEWYAARLGRIRALRRVGRPDDASKLAALTRLVAPPAAGSAVAAELDALVDDQLVE